jgi:hypothetical protein
MPRGGEHPRSDQRRVGVAYARVAIFENPAAGASINDIMEWVEGLDREQVKAVIKFVTRGIDRAPALMVGALRLLSLLDETTNMASCKCFIFNNVWLLPYIKDVMLCYFFDSSGARR